MNNDPENMETRPNSTIIAELDKARNNLLELSTRNRLINIPQSSRAKLVRIVDEKSVEIYKLLAEKGRTFSFLASTSIEYDDSSEDDPNEEFYLPPLDEEFDAGETAARHTDTKFQTALKPQKLQSRLLSMYGDARTFIEEQGVNILYLSLGQLKWYESESSDLARYAPLVLVPVRLERASASSQFKLKALTEDPSENLTLAARLNEFRVQLPILDTDGDNPIEEYFGAVSESIKPMESWEVLPDAIVLGFFSFSKLLMYRDLDPTNWPDNARIDEYPLVRGLLYEGFTASN